MSTVNRHFFHIDIKFFKHIIKTGDLMNETMVLIKGVSDLLGIKVPTVSYDESKFLTKTQLAGVDLDKNIIYIKAQYDVKFDGYFAICHELRHIWQYKNVLWQKELNSRRRNDQTDIEYYNNQISELDANAFATFFMMNQFRVKPLFKNLDPKTKEKIFKRAKEIETEYKKRGSLN